jgi:CrcB protein
LPDEVACVSNQCKGTTHPLQFGHDLENFSIFVNQIMKLLLAIGAGSFIGGISRYLLSQWVQARFLSTFPYGTMSVNIIGCLLMGIVYGLTDRGNLGEEWRLFLATGVLGGFTTFSAFSNETVAMLRDGQALSAMTYVMISILIGLAATFLGISLTKLL